MAKQLEQTISWRVTKVIYIIIALAGLAYFVSFVPGALSNCDWQHRQYISGDDVTRSFFAAPTESLADCQAGDVYMKYALVFGVYVLTATILYFVIRRIFSYVRYGKQSS